MLRNLINSLSSKKSTKSLKSTNSFRPRFEALEERALMAAGLLDTSFAGDGKREIAFDLANSSDTDQATAMAVQSDGKIVVVGYVDNGANGYDFAVTRLEADGVTLDQGFGTGGKFTVGFNLGNGSKNDRAYGVTIQDDGKIVVVGEVERDNSDYDFGVIRLEANGTPDMGFASAGKKTMHFDIGGSKIDSAFAVTMNGDKIVIAGQAQKGPLLDFDFAVVQLESNGDYDANFAPGGNEAANSGNGLATIPFDISGIMLDRVNAVSMQNGKIVLAGQATTANGYDMAVARLNGVNGALDMTFSPGGTEGSGKELISFNLGGNEHDVANAMVIQPDGKIILAGYAQRNNTGDNDFALVRLLEDGGLDVNGFGDNGQKLVVFDIPGGTKGDVATAVTLQSDGKIVVGGTVATGVAGNSDFGIARLNADGGGDATFGTDGKVTVAFDKGGSNTDTVAGIGLQSGNRVVVAGSIQRTAATDIDFGVARLLADPPAAPTVTNPTSAVVVDQNSFTIQGNAAIGSLVKVYKDVNNNNQIDAGDTVVGQQQLLLLNTAYSINVPLQQTSANNFLVTATKLNSESTPTNVPTITDVFTEPKQQAAAAPEGIVARIMRKKRKSFVEVRGAQTGMVRRLFGPYTKARIAMQDINADGTLDLVMQINKNGKKQLQVYSGVDLSLLYSSKK